MAAPSPLSSSRRNWKYCFVPRCGSTEFKYPEKIFISVPLDEKRRVQWFRAARRADSGKGNTTHFHCCEEHFDLEHDMENYMRYKLQSGACNIRMRKDAVPSRFSCQADVRARDSDSNVSERSTSVQRARRSSSKAIAEECLTNAVAEEQSLPPVDDSDAPTEQAEVGTSLDAAVQVQPRSLNKAVQTVTEHRLDRAVQTDPCLSLANAETMDEGVLSDYSGEEDVEATDPDWEESAAEANCSDSDDSDISDNSGTIDPLPYTRYLNKTFPRTYLGVMDGCYYVVEELAKWICYKGKPMTQEDVVCLVLRKVRLNPSFKMLGHQFHISTSQASFIFAQYLPVVARLLSGVLFWPSSAAVKEHLPLAFRARFSKVTSIIDCFEIFIQKPSKACHQSLTWSDYKHSNTAKYLVSITPSGLVNYISKGYGGRASDIIIVKESDYLNTIPYPTTVMADRGFKQIESVLKSNKCSLVRPDSVAGGVALTREQVLNSKRIASLRIHVERAIRRIREFEMLKPCASIPTRLLDLLDDSVIVACSLTNLQGPLVVT